MNKSRTSARLLLCAAVVVAALAAAVPARADHGFVITASDATTAYGDTVTLNARLVDPDSGCFTSFCPASNRQVDFYVDGAFVGTDLTNSGGYAHLLIVADPTWHVGSHVITARYERESPAATDDAVLKIVSETTGVDARDGYLEAQLLDNDGAALVGFAIRFHVTGPDAEEHDLCTAFTDATGSARCTPVSGVGVTPFDAAETTYTATFDGTGDFTASEGTATLL